MRFASRECRWFFDGELDDDIVEWFRVRKPWKQSGELGTLDWPKRARVDRYVVISNNLDIGLKWRGEPVEGEGRTELEFKGKVASLGVLTLAPGVTGVVERWVKWACDGETLQASSSVDVEKRRILREVRLDSLGTDLEVPRVDREFSVKRGLQIELTTLSLAAAPYWTLGFEAFPDDSDLHEEFSRNVSLFLQELPGSLRLSADRSFSYPEWLVRQHTNHAETLQ